MPIYGIRNRGNTCYASAVLQCLSCILGCIPTDLVDLDSIPRIMSDAQEYYELLVSRNRILKKIVETVIHPNIVVPYVLPTQLDSVRETNIILPLRVHMQGTVASVDSIVVRDTKYRLICAIIHSNHHYTAIVHNDSKWYICDDENVYEIGMNVSLPLYLLFYKYVPESNVSS